MNPLFTFICLGVSVAILVKGWQFGDSTIMMIGAAWFCVGLLALLVGKLKRRDD